MESTRLAVHTQAVETVTAIHGTQTAAAEQMPEDVAVMPSHPENLNPLTNISPIMDEVDNLFLANNRPQAEDMLNNLLDKNPDNFDALFARSQLFALDWDENNISGQDAQHMIDLEPDNPLGYLALSDSWLNEPDSNTDLALEAIQHAAELDPENPNIIWRVAALNDSDWQAQRAGFLKAEELGASGFRYIYNIGNMFYWNGEYPRALPYLEVGSNGNPDYWMTQDNFWMLLGAMMKTNQAQGALDLLSQRGIMDNTTDADVFVDAAYIAYNAENYDLAKEWADTASVLSNEAYGATYVLGLMAWRVDKDVDKALELLNSLDGTEVYTRYLNFDFGHSLNLDRARILTEAGRFEEALGFYDSAIAENDYVDWLYEERANVHLALGQTDEAKSDLQHAFEITEDTAYRNHLRQRLLDIGAASSSN